MLTPIAQRPSPTASPVVLAGVCLRHRGTRSKCDECARECPTAAVELEESDVLFNSSCVACGRCTAVCPSGAISLPGWRITPGDRGVKASRLRVECERTPERIRSTSTSVCACLGGLDAGQLLELVHSARGSAVELVDRGWCVTCAAGDRESPPGARTRERVSQLLADMGLPELAPRVVRELVAGSSRDDACDRRRLRRRFLQYLARPAAHPAAVVSDGARKRSAELALLARIAATHAVELPASAFPAVQTRGECRDHGVCAAICPTGALNRYDTGEVRGLEFIAARCIACGECEAICPEHAISLDATGSGRVPPGAVRLTAHQSRVCARCDEAFAATSGADSLCPACRKDVALFAGGLAPRADVEASARSSLSMEN